MFENINKGEWILIPVKHAFWSPAMLQVDPNIMNKHILFPAQVFSVHERDNYFVVELDIGTNPEYISVNMDGSIKDVPSYYKAEPLTLRIYEQNFWIKDYIEAKQKKNDWRNAMCKFFKTAHSKEISLKDTEKE